jgi:hypothetical protein
MLNYGASLETTLPKASFSERQWKTLEVEPVRVYMRPGDVACVPGDVYMQHVQRTTRENGRSISARVPFGTGDTIAAYICGALTLSYKCLQDDTPWATDPFGCFMSVWDQYKNQGTVDFMLSVCGWYCVTSSKAQRRDIKGCEG